MMTFTHAFAHSLPLLAALLALNSVAFAQQSAGGSPLQSLLAQSAQSGKFTFIVFHRDQSEATRAFTQQTETALAPFADKATVTTARVDDPAERALVEKLGISRAPMPMTVSLAPNGAITGLFPRTLTPENVSVAMVPPTMMKCMKELQNQKLVFVALTKSESAVVPAGVQIVQQYPQFKDRISVVEMKLDDPAEARFYQQMKLNSAQVTGPYAVLIAPPGILIGHFDATASADQIAAAIHHAGQCCEDPNCKHNHAAPATPPQATAPRSNAR